MTENAFTRKLLRALRSHAALRDAYIAKHNDISTGGIPDFSVSIGAKTIWAEVKRYPNKPTKLQWATILKLDVGCLLITDHRNGSIGLWQASKPATVVSFDELVEEIARRVL